MNEKRRLISHHTVDGVDHVSINIRKWKGVAGFLGAIVATSLTIAGLVLSLLHPVVTRWIHEETHPAELETATEIYELQKDVAELQRLSVPRQELDSRMTRIEDRLDDIYKLLARGQR
jgi:hypothetical protein